MSVFTRLAVIVDALCFDNESDFVVLRDLVGWCGNFGKPSANYVVHHTMTFNTEISCSVHVCLTMNTN